MGTCGIHINQQFGFPRLPKLHQFPDNKISVTVFHFDDGTKLDTSRLIPCSSFSSEKPKWDSDKFLVRAASASSPLSGSAAEFTDQVLGAKPKQKTQTIAGVDQEELEDPTVLADSDSCFCEFNGVQLHHKFFDATSSNQDNLSGSSSQFADHSKSVKHPMILLHGFGASVFSWNRVLEPLAKAIHSKVLAFDRPAFGLTSRKNAISYSSAGNQDKKPLSPYSMIFSVLATLYFIGFLDAEKAILVGHSAGALVAVDAYFEAPERIAALILAAPAILAPLVQNTQKPSEGGTDNDNQILGNGSASNTGSNVFRKLLGILSKFTRYIMEVIVHMVKGMAGMINSLYKQALSAILRSTVGVMLIRMIIDKFGISAIRMSWYDPKQISDHVLQGYTKPLKVKGWDKALVEYTVAMLTDAVSNIKPPLTKRLSEISCPVLIVTGDTDRIVPSWNAERLAQTIPGSRLEIIKNCGHLLQEEKPEEFVSIINKFLQGVFGSAEEPCLQVAI